MSNAGDTPSEPGDTPSPEDLRQQLKLKAKRFAPGLVNSADAEDLAQETLIIGHVKSSLFRGEGSRFRWLVAILRNRVRKWVRISVRAPVRCDRLPQNENGEILVADSHDSTEASAVQGQVLMIRKIMRHLAAEDRQFVEVAFLDPVTGMLKSAELAKELGVKADAVRKQKERLVRHLRRAAQLIQTLEAYGAPDHYRQVLCWKRIQNCSLAVMAAELEVRESEVRMRLHQAEAWLAATGEIHDQSD